MPSQRAAEKRKPNSVHEQAWEDGQESGQKGWNKMKEEVDNKVDNKVDKNELYELVLAFLGKKQK